MFVIDSVNVTKIWYFLSGVDARMRLGTVLPGDNVLGLHTCAIIWHLVTERNSDEL